MIYKLLGDGVIEIHYIWKTDYHVYIPKDYLSSFAKMIQEFLIGG